MSRPGRPLFFDLDGTLTDPKLGITNCIIHAMRVLDVNPPSADELEWCIGPPLHDSFVQLVGESRAADAVTHYRERFADVGLFENKPYPGIAETLENYAASRPLYVASSKPRVFVERILERFGLDHFFHTAFGSELDGTRVDKGELLSYALQASGEVGPQCIMVGDRKHDAIGAASQGMGMVGVLYGYGSKSELTDAGVQHLASTPAELPGVIDRVSIN